MKPQMSSKGGTSEPIQATSETPAAATQETAEPSKEHLLDFNTYGADLESKLLLRSYPIAIKMLTNEAEIPEGALRPKKDLGEHYAMCQMISMVRHRGMIVAPFIEDHWCFEPIISYGLVEPPEDYLNGYISSFFIADKEAARKRDQEHPRLPVGKYPGMVLAPLSQANFLPDLVMIYCNAGQLRHLVFALMHVSGYRVTSTLDAIGSCVHALVPSLLTGECAVTVPDPGDYERGMAEEDEMVLTVPITKLKELMDGIYKYEELNMTYRSFLAREVKPDFVQPPFYQEYFKKWGLDTPKK